MSTTQLPEEDFSTSHTFIYLVSKLMDLEKEAATHAAAAKTLKAQIDRLKMGVLPDKMNAEEIQTVNLKGIGRLSNTSQMRVSAVAGTQPQLFTWLEDNGYGALIGTTINSSTLKAFIKERIAAGEEYPDELINMHSFEQVTLTKK